MAWRRAGSCPLERIAIAPWVVNSNNLTVAVGLEYVPYQWDDRCTKDEGEDGGNLVEDRESIRFQVVGVTTWHTHVANPVLNKRSEERRVGKECRARWAMED